jgi:hypothetical protein
MIIVNSLYNVIILTIKQRSNKMKKIAIVLTTILSVMSFNVLAEGGSDRLAERNKKIVKENVEKNNKDLIGVEISEYLNIK